MIKNRNIVNDVKLIKANHKSLREFAKNKYLDEDGNANIHIYINNLDLYNKYSNPKTPELSDELISYIEKEVFYIPVEYPVILNIHSNDDVDTEYVSSKLKEHYWKELANKNTDLKKNTLISIILFIIGIIFLSLYLSFEFIDNLNMMFNEIFSIIGTFAIWECIDFALINRGALNIEKLNLVQLALIETKKATD